MKKIAIKLKNMFDAKHLAQVAMSCDFDVDYICGSYNVDAKSILGVLGLPMLEPAYLVLHTENDVSGTVEKLRVRGLLAEE